MRIIGGRSWSASSMTSSESRPRPERGSFIVEPSSANSRTLPPLLEPLHDGLEDHERHPRQALELLVAVDPPLEVDLAEPLDPGPLRGVDQVPDLDRVAGEERDLLEQRPATRVLAGERLDHPDSSGKNRLMRGRATSSVTRPPPPSLSTPPETMAAGSRP